MEKTVDLSVQVHVANLASTKPHGRNYTVDAFRLLGAFCIVFLHIPTYGAISKSLVVIIDQLARWAVPFFFIVGGYYFEIGLRSNPDTTFLKRLKSLLSIFLTSNFIYLLFILLRRNEPVAVLLNLSTFVIGTHDHLWFIGSMIFGYIFLWFLLEIKAVKLLPFFAIAVLLLIFITGGYARFILPETVNFRFSRQLISIPFLIGGYLFSRYNLINRISIFHGAILIAAGIFFQIIEQNFIFKYTGSTISDLLFGSCLYAAGMFFLALKISVPKTNVVTRLGREYSLIIYLYHPIVISLFFNYVLPRIKFGNPLFLLLAPVIVFFITLITVILMRKKLTGLYNVLNGSSWKSLQVLPVKN